MTVGFGHLRKRMVVTASCAFVMLATVLALNKLRDVSILGVSKVMCAIPDVSLDHRRIYLVENDAVLYTDSYGRSKTLSFAGQYTKTVPALDSITNGMRIWHGQIELSPDKTRFLIIDDENVTATVCSVDGTIYGRWRLNNYVSGAWYQDSRHWFLVQGGGNTTERAKVLLYDTNSPRLRPKNVGIVSDQFSRAPVVVNRTGAHACLMPSQLQLTGSVKILTAPSLTDNLSGKSELRIGALGDAPTALECSFSPGGRFLLWTALMPRPAYTCTAKFEWPFVQFGRSASRVELWLSDSWAKDLRYIGHFPVKNGLASWPGEIVWQPNDAGISYVYDGRLYAYTIE